MSPATDMPGYALEMERCFGPPSQTGFGSAVFFEMLDKDVSLEQAALANYRHFVGDLWERWGESAWMAPWSEVYRRGSGGGDIVAELGGLNDPTLGTSVDLLLNGSEDPAATRQALAAGYDDPAVTELAVFRAGDGEAISGLLVAGRRGATGAALFLVLLMD